MVDTAYTTNTASSAPPPPRRFAPNAAKPVSTEPSASSRAPSYVFLRVKRKRNEDPVESLLVHSEPELKRQQRADTNASSDGTNATSTDTNEPSKSQQRGLLAAFTKLSTADRDFVFKRIDTLEPHQLAAADEAKWTERLKRKAKSIKKETRVTAKQAAADKLASAPTQNRVQQQQARLKERRHSDALRTRGLLPSSSSSLPPPPAPLELKEQRTLELPGMRVVDVSAVASTPSTPASTLTVNGAALATKRVLNPHERQVDEAVWTAFQRNDFAPFFRIFNSHRPELKTDPAAFQRPADGGTILMAAAMHGRADVIEAVLRSSAARVLQEDWTGARASEFARRHGHSNVEAALLACEAAEHEKEYVYDVYCIDLAASEQRAIGGRAGDDTLASAPVVSVSSAVQRWLAQEASGRRGGGANEDDDDDVDEFMLESDGDNDVDDDGESIDSNHENHAFNDYPDEDEGDNDNDDDSDDYDSDDSNENLRRRAAGHHQHVSSSARGTRGDYDSFDY